MNSDPWAHARSGKGPGASCGDPMLEDAAAFTAKLGVNIQPGPVERGRERPQHRKISRKNKYFAENLGTDRPWEAVDRNR